MNLKLVNTRPKRNRHVIESVRFVPRSNEGMLKCVCGESMLASQFAEHRKSVGARLAKSSLSVPDMLRGQASVWNRTTSCVAGHPQTPENTYRYNGRRSCRLCRLDRAREQTVAKRRAAA